jgi:phosphopentomutase
MSKRALVIVLDSVGCGGAPDAGDYGDDGADTLGHLFSGVPWLCLPNLDSLGLAGLMGRPSSASIRKGSSAFRLTEISTGKDTTTGHWELMGYLLKEAFQTFESFPEEFVEALSAAAGTRFIGNRAASGTEILKELGEEHIRTGFPILYTSADSVLQIAAHEETFGEGRLQGICRMARALLDERGIRVGRVIARPFTGHHASGFRRTANRHDYSLTPGETVMDRLVEGGVEVIGVGKISDIFAGKGVSTSYPTKDNAQGMAAIDRIWRKEVGESVFVFANLVDFDSLFGHRRDPEGYARCLMEFDAWLGGFLEAISGDDLLIITADHGNDPYHHGTDHTREQVPCLLVRGSGFGPDGMHVFSDVGACVERHFLQQDCSC